MPKMHIEEVDAHFSRIIATDEQSYKNMCTAYMTAIKQDVLDALKKGLHVQDGDAINGWGDYYVRGGYEYAMDHDDVLSAVLPVTQDVLDTYSTLPDLSGFPLGMVRYLLADRHNKDVNGVSRDDFVNGVANQFRSEAIQHFLTREINDTLADLHTKMNNVHKMLDGVDTESAIKLSVLLKDGLSRVIDSVDARIVANNSGKDTSSFVLSTEDAVRQTRVIEMGDGFDAYVFARNVKGADIQALQQVVVERGDGDAAYRFAKDIRNADTQALQQVVLDRGNGWDAYRFANGIQNADTEALQAVILERGDGWDAYYFAVSVHGANTKALQDAVLDRGDGKILYYFAENVIGADLKLFHNRLVELNAKGSDVNRVTGKGRYLDKFNNNSVIQENLKAQMHPLPANGQSKNRVKNP